MVMTRLVVGIPVDGRDGPLGTLAGTREVGARTPGAFGTPTGDLDRPQGFVLVRLSRLFGLHHTMRVVPLAWVRPAATDARRVTLDATRAEVVGCPPLRSDAALQADVRAALRAAVSKVHLARLQASVHDGVVDMTGHAASRRARLQAISCAWEVPGVLGVHDHVIDDDTLTLAVAQALADAPETREAQLLVTSQLGVVWLSGTLPTQATKERATALAGAVVGVSDVQNGVTISTAP
jgi:osmotically-inducible protein OsmY